MFIETKFVPEKAWRSTLAGQLTFLKKVLINLAAGYLMFSHSPKMHSGANIGTYVSAELRFRISGKVNLCSENRYGRPVRVCGTP